MKYLDSKIDCECPVCKRNDCVKLWETNCEEAAQHFVLKEKDAQSYINLANHIEQLWGQRNNVVVKCLNCDLCFSHPFIAGDEKFYSLAYHRTGYPNWKWEYQITFNFLKSKRKGFKLLEIGAGNGSFIKPLVNNFTSKENIYCTEFSEYGIQKLNEIGVKCFDDDIRNINFKEKFDIICMFQVLEHLDHLDDLFNSINDLLLKGGDFFVAVPDPKYIEFIELNGALLDMPPNHVTRWSRNAFQIIASRYNWQITKHRIHSAKWIDKIKQFALFYFLRKSQKKGSLANKICSLHHPVLILKILKIIGILFYSFSLIRVFYKLRVEDIGHSQWIHFSKKY